MQHRIKGVIPALLVPVDEKGHTIHKLLATQTRYLVDHGAAGIFVNGSTAESAFMTTEERVEIVRTVQEVVQGAIPLFVACILPGTNQVVEEITAMAPLEPDFIVATTQFYFGVSQSAILEHYRRIAAASPVPVVAYDIPSCTHNKMSFETLTALPTIPNVVGVKDSSGDFITFSRAMRATGEAEFAWIQGDDYLDSVSLLTGAAAIVTGTGNVNLDPYVELYTAAQRGDIAGATAWQRRIDHLCGVFERAERNVIPGIKSAVTLLGRGTHHTRLPGTAVPERYHPAIAEVLREAELL